MTINLLHHKPSMMALLAATLIGISTMACADERADLEQLRATTLSLIEALVDNGVLSRDKADKLMQDAEARAKVKLAEAPPPEIGKDGKKVVHISYVPESVKQEIREQVEQEVLAQAKTERWGDPGALPDWLSRIKFEGDIRMRYETTRLSPDNSAPGNPAFTDGAFTRAADIADNSSNNLYNSNTQDNSSRWRLRARLGATAQITDMVSTGLFFSTGNTTNRVSTNQTLGQNFNKYSVVIDRGYVKLDPKPWLSVSGGRIANPYFGTDLVWADDLNFEGVAVTLKPELSPTVNTFFTAGWFPLSENSPSQSNARNLVGIQGGLEWKLTPKTQFKFGAALYDYHGLDGVREDDNALATVPDYGTRYEYPSGLRQRGNTLFILNSPSDPVCPAAGCHPNYWGLASGFRELNLTGSLDLGQFDPTHIILTGDYVKNLAFNRSDIFNRTGVQILDGKSYGYMAKIQVGRPAIVNRGDWNVSLAYRYLGSDAVLDAFTNADFGLGGTNNKGVILGFNYGIDKNTWLSARWMSSDLIDPMVPAQGGTSPSTKLSADVFQLDLNARF